MHSTHAIRRTRSKHRSNEQLKRLAAAYTEDGMRFTPTTYGKKHWAVWDSARFKYVFIGTKQQCMDHAREMNDEHQHPEGMARRAQRVLGTTRDWIQHGDDDDGYHDGPSDSQRLAANSA